MKLLLKRIFTVRFLFVIHRLVILKEIVNHVIASLKLNCFKKIPTKFFMLDFFYKFKHWIGQIFANSTKIRNHKKIIIWQCSIMVLAETK